MVWCCSIDVVVVVVVMRTRQLFLLMCLLLDDYKRKDYVVKMKGTNTMMPLPAAAEMLLIAVDMTMASLLSYYYTAKVG